MPTATWEICLDLTGEGDFSGTNEDITSDVQEISWEIGFSRAYTHIPPPNICTIVVNNSTGEYSPEHGGAVSGFDIGNGVRIRSIYGGTVEHGYYWVSPGGIEPTPFTWGERRTRITCEDWLQRASNYQVDHVATQINKRGDELITTLLEETIMYPPGFIGYWVLGYSKLGVNTVLGAGASDYVDAEEGISVFPYAFDNEPQQRGRQADLYTVLKGIVESERGWVFVGRNGKVIFWNRHHLAKIVSSGGTIADTMMDMAYTYGPDIANIITVKSHPRSIDTDGTPVLGTIDKAIRITREGTVAASISFKDADSGVRVSSTDVITPVAVTDYIVNTAEDGSGTDITASVLCTCEPRAQSAKLTFTNLTSSDGYILAGSKIRGNNKITDFGNVETTVEDVTSISRYGHQALVIDARELEDFDIANAIARWTLLHRKDPRGRPLTISFRPYRSDALLTLALTKTIGDRITITETQTGLDADFFIMGEKHMLQDGLTDYIVEWVLQPVEGLVWILGTSELGANTYLGV